MRNTFIATTLAAAIGLPVVAIAQTTASATAEPTPDHIFTGNVGLFSEYRFRGISQTFGKPAIQGGFDYTHASGVYLGNWNSNISQGAGFPGGNIEMDFYGGWEESLGAVGVGVGGGLFPPPRPDDAVPWAAA